MSATPSHRWWWLPTIYVIFLAYQSLIGENIWNCGRELSKPFFRGAGISMGDFLANFVAYVPLGFLLAAPRVRVSYGRALMFASLLGFSLSLLMESLQLCLPGRIPSSNDLIANTLGAFFGGLSAWAWFFWNEGRVSAKSDAKDLPLALKSSALRVLVFLATLAWVGYQTKPWVFTLDLGQLRANFSWIKHMDDHPWSWFGFARHICAWMALLLAWRLSASVRPSRFQEGSNNGQWLVWALASLGFAIGSQAGLEVRALGPEELLGMLCALLMVGLVSLALRQKDHVQSALSVWMLLFAFGAVLAYQLEPGAAPALVTGARSKLISLLPKLGTQQLIHAIDYALFFGWFGIMVAVATCSRSSSTSSFQKLAGASNASLTSESQTGGDRSAGGGTALFALGWKLPLVAAFGVTATEAAQYWIPGRGVDSSPVIFTLLGYLFANRLISRDRPIL
jgi:VanZ family protein